MNGELERILPLVGRAFGGVRIADQQQHARRRVDPTKRIKP